MRNRVVTIAAVLFGAVAVRAEEPNAWDLLESGIAAHQRGDSRRAQEAFEAALAKDPRCEDCHYYLGILGAKAGDTKRAIACFQKVSDQYPTYALAQGELGLLALQLKDVESAATYFENSAKARASADSWMQLATVQMDLKRFEAAEASLGEADKLTKQNYRLIEMWARLYLESKRPGMAVERYTQLVEKFPRDPIPLHLRGLCYLEMERTDEAVADLRAVLAMDPFHVGSIHRLRALWKDDPSKERELADLDRRLEQLKKNPPKVRRR
jgi:tetratricopeptide (TPR) repeat protein